jgi:hypothetical protein
MILLHKVIVDIGSFNETNCVIFNDVEREPLRKLFVEQCGSSPYRFLSALSPEQKQHVAVWACQRTTFPVDQLISSLKKFTKYLEGVSYTVYPHVPAAKTEIKKKKKKIFN